MENKENAVDVSTQEPKKCKKCSKGMSMGQKTMLIVSFYILFTSIYGTIKLFKDVLTYFN